MNGFWLTADLALWVVVALLGYEAEESEGSQGSAAAAGESLSYSKEVDHV